MAASVVPVRGDLVQALKRLYTQVRSFDAVLIETHRYG